VTDLAKQKYYLGSQGPFTYEDTDLLVDPDIGTVAREAIVTQGQMRVLGTPVSPYHVARKQEVDAVSMPSVAVLNINDPSPELLLKSGLQIGILLIAYQSVLGTVDPFTLYCWDDNIASNDSPYVVNGAGGGHWIAVGGKYNAQYRTSSFTVVTALQNNAGTYQYKKRIITVQGTIGAESAWTNV